MTFQIELSDELAVRVQEEADRQGIDVQQFVQRAVEAICLKPRTKSDIKPGRVQSFAEALEATVSENDELYRRLAQ